MISVAQRIPRDLLAFAAWRNRGAPMDEATELARLGMIPILGGATTFGPLYGTSNQAITCGFASTASAHGRISNAVTNTGTPPFYDAGLFCKVKTGSSGPTGNKQVIVYALGSVDGGTTYTDGFAIGDADSAVVPNTAKVIGIIPTPSSATTYYLGPVSVGVAFLNGVLTDHWGIYVFNDLGQTVDTTAGNFAFFYQGVGGTTS